MNHFYEILLAAALLFPFVGFWILVLKGSDFGKPNAGWFAVFFGMGVPLVISTVVLVGWSLEGPDSRAELTAAAQNFQFLWADLGDVEIKVGVKLDSLTVAMFFMVALVSFCIFVFSIGYMSGHSDEVGGHCHYGRFFAYLSLFGFSMLGLVISSSLLFLFIFWELVGVCSYLLIGFYFDRGYASHAGMKAFVTNRVGDFGFLVGMMLVVFMFRTLDLEQAAAAFSEQYHTNTGLFGQVVNLFGWSISGMSLATLMGIALFCGAMGKSAQFPLHVWLPDAMAGPTPVSALIHAATMVAAGVYLVARVFRLLTPDAQMFIAVIGVITLTAMALIAIVQVDIKKCLAYSTLSQLGYMIFAMGVGAWIAALFHLMTHAFFKAMLFLGSGQVIEGCHHEQDMRKMGGLRRKMPFTCWTFFVGVLAITGAGIPGAGIGLGGYFSKDEILAVAYDRSYNWDRYEDRAGGGDRGDAHANRHPHQRSLLSPGAGINRTPDVRLARFLQDEADHGDQAEHQETSAKAAIAAGIKALPKWMFWLAIITAYVTPFYMFRCWWMTFMGKPRDEHVYEHAHEIRLMYIPLVVLSVGILVSSYFIFRPLIAESAGIATDASLVVSVDGEAHHATPAYLALDHSEGHNPHTALISLVGFAFLIGFAVAWAIYRNGLALAERIRQMPVMRYVYVVLVKKYFFDEFYDFFLVKGCVVVARIIRFFDTWVVDLICNLLAVITERLSAFSGWVLDIGGIDGFLHGVVDSANDLSEGLRRPQSGRVRGYVVLAVGVATLVIGGILIFPWLADVLPVGPSSDIVDHYAGVGEWLVWLVIAVVVLLGVLVIQMLTVKAERVVKKWWVAP